MIESVSASESASAPTRAGVTSSRFGGTFVSPNTTSERYPAEHADEVAEEAGAWRRVGRERLVEEQEGRRTERREGERLVGGQGERRHDADGETRVDEQVDGDHPALVVAVPQHRELQICEAAPVRTGDAVPGGPRPEPLTASGPRFERAEGLPRRATRRGRGRPALAGAV